MSLILDALRKSDDERNQSSAPTVASPTAQTPQASTPRWIWPVVALLAVNALILVWVLTSREQAPSTAETTVSPATEVAQPAAEPVVTPTRRAEVRSLLAETIDEARDARREAEQTPSAVASPPDNKNDAPAASIAPPESNAITNEQVPVYQIGQAVADWQWPALTLELHVFTEDPSTRFGFINGQKITEGGRLSEGPYVAEISRQGVILEFRSRRLLLKP
ncbi:MAG: general secretion pathway protein GspB [Pseudomonadota bacterium]